MDGRREKERRRDRLGIGIGKVIDSQFCAVFLTDDQSKSGRFQWADDGERFEGSSSEGNSSLSIGNRHGAGVVDLPSLYSEALVV